MVNKLTEWQTSFPLTVYRTAYVHLKCRRKTQCISKMGKSCVAIDCSIDCFFFTFLKFKDNGFGLSFCQTSTINHVQYHEVVFDASLSVLTGGALNHAAVVFQGVIILTLT